MTSSDRHPTDVHPRLDAALRGLAKSRLFQVSLIVALALAVRLAGIDQEPLHDELYTFLAAESWAEGGDFRILPDAEPYDRAWIFTTIVGSAISALGSSLEAARIPAVLFGTAVAGGVTWWLAGAGFAAAGVLAGALVALDPQLIQLSQVSRFYALQHLAFLLGCSSFVRFVDAEPLSPMRRFALGLTSGLLLALAYHLQPVTLIGVGGLLLFGLVWPGSWLHRRLRRWLRRDPKEVGAAVAVVVGLGLLAAWASGLLEWFVQRATYADLWAHGARDNLRFYYAWLHDHYATLVVLSPLLALLAVVRAPKIGVLSVIVFGVAFTAHSFMAWKANRYLSYALPFFFVLGSIGIVDGVRRLWHGLPGLLDEIDVLTGSRASLVAGAAILLIVASLAVGNRGFLVTSRLLGRNPELHFPLMAEGEPSTSWSRATPVLDSIASAEVEIVSSSPVKAIFFLERLDYILSRSSLYWPGGLKPEFWVDHRFGRPVISTAESLRRVHCEERALVIVESVSIDGPRTPLAGAVDYLRRKGESVSLPSGAGLEVFLLEARDGTACDPPGVPGGARSNIGGAG